eukprot:5256879-Pyramimonas_sp.AAC.1
MYNTPPHPLPHSDPLRLDLLPAPILLESSQPLFLGMKAMMMAGLSKAEARGRIYMVDSKGV